MGRDGVEDGAPMGRDGVEDGAPMGRDGAVRAVPSVVSSADLGVTRYAPLAVFSRRRFAGGGGKSLGGRRTGDGMLAAAAARSSNPMSRPSGESPGEIDGSPPA